MKCPFCGLEEDRVIESRSVEEGEGIRRRRECEKCERRFTTYERVKEWDLMVVKKDDRRELFDEDKLKHGIIKALEKRPIKQEEVDKAVRAIEMEIREMASKEVTSKEIGELVINKLKEIDEVAYIRFASVYRQFKDINEFLDEIKRLV